jgi:hypothetical protein
VFHGVTSQELIVNLLCSYYSTEKKEKIAWTQFFCPTPEKTAPPVKAAEGAGK